MPRIRSINEEDLNAMVGRWKAADSEAKLLAENLARRQKETLPDFEKCPLHDLLSFQSLPEEILTMGDDSVETFAFQVLLALSCKRLACNSIDMFAFYMDTG